MSQSIRKGTAGDFQNMKELVGNTEKIMDEWSREQWSSSLQREDVEIFVAEEEGAIHGYAVVRLSKKDPTSFTERPTAAITHLCVPSCESQLRQQLVQKCLSWAKQKGATDFSL
ncbi:hypothetical protein GA0061096_4653 [Fictibacillus enclensis]|uniref:N-acetyltransferase domain-containing protein n=1 Tax=Fictibacillus enclensis TaxID=1017270 RepID=A0A0V8IRL4_9BACL|nr:GNAT family N-acetyltransferase [Fictibacillus enclensis]KSU77375.1 hypothetical protein AS030_22175 [Fictibacillus enclensis]SCC41655.1 hypothetical protein GA0061096_4653 [Fictibacillus enclensis]